MKVYDIYAYLDGFCPFDTACDFDNAGLLIGNKNTTVSKAVVSLDLTPDAFKQAKKVGAQLIITHHPVIFSGLKNITADSYLYDIIKSDISVISAHTNLDAADGGVNDCLANTLELENISKIICEDGFSFRKGELKSEMTPEQFAHHVYEKLGLKPRFTVGLSNIKTVAVCGGSGGDMLNDAYISGADAFVTSDIKHNVFLDSVHLGITLLDCGHFATEDVVIEPLTALLRQNFSDIEFLTNHKTYITELI